MVSALEKMQITFEKELNQQISSRLYGSLSLYNHLHNRIEKFISVDLPQYCAPLLNLHESDKYFEILILLCRNFIRGENLLDPSDENLRYYSRSKWVRNYDFLLGNSVVRFRLRREEPEGGGKHKPKRYFILSRNPPVFQLNANKNTITFYFEFRSLIESDCIPLIKKKSKYILNKNIKEILSVLHQLDTEEKRWPNLRGDLQTQLSEALEYYSIPHDFDSIHFLYTKAYIDQFVEFVTQQRIIPLVFQLSEDRTTKSSLQSTISTVRKVLAELISVITSINKLITAFHTKKKFIFNTDYGLTLDLIPPALTLELLNSKTQEKEWERTLNIDTKELIGELESIIGTKKGEGILVQLHHYSPEIQFKVISNIFEGSKRALDGFIVHGDNGDGLDLIGDTFHNSVVCTYIDPPYNTGTGDFIYHDKFQRKKWNYFIRSRLRKVLDIMAEKGIFYSSIDDNEVARYMELLEEIFPRRLNTIIWHKKTQPSYLSKELIPVVEYIVAAKKSETPLKMMGSYGDLQKLTELINIGNKVSSRIIAKDNVLIANDWTGKIKRGIYGKDKLQVQILNSVSVTDGKPDNDLHLESRFKWTQERINHEISIGGIVHIKSTKSLRPTILRHYDAPIIRGPTTLLSKKVNNAPTNTDANREMKNLFQISPFDYSKPSELIQYLVRSITFQSKTGWILDFFAGSGATAQAVINQNNIDGGNRKYVLIERESYLDHVILPRIMKTVFSSQWRDGKTLKKEGISHFYQKFSIESVTDAIRNLESSEKFDCDKLGYAFDLENPDSPLKLNISEFLSPYSYFMENEINGVISSVKIDLVETFNFLIGLKDPQRRYLEHQNRWYSIISSQTDKEDIYIIWRPIENLNLEEEAIFLSGLNFYTRSSNNIRVYHNSTPVNLSDVKLCPIEPEFNSKMFQ